jgi:glycosyltransferase involved in cell wall biosynthesis
VGIDQGKIVIMPLAYEQPRVAQEYRRCYPDRFTHGRPLRVLFLGQIIIRKGIAAVLAAAQILSDRPIEFWFVGSPGISDLPSLANVRWVGPVSRDETARYYRDADLFLFPTLSDGFGLTQLEAQAWKLPVIASQFCGDVVKDRVNGFVLPQVTGDAIALVLRSCLDRPQMLTALARQAAHTVRGFSLAMLRRDLEALDNPWPFVDRAPGALPEPAHRFRAREDVGALVDQER